MKNIKHAFYIKEICSKENDTFYIFVLFLSKLLLKIFLKKRYYHLFIQNIQMSIGSLNLSLK